MTSSRVRRIVAWCVLVGMFMVVVAFQAAQHRADQAQDRRQNADRAQLEETVKRLDATVDGLEKETKVIDAQVTFICDFASTLIDHTHKTFADSIDAILATVPPSQPHGPFVDALLTIRASLDERYPPLQCP